MKTLKEYMNESLEENEFEEYLSYPDEYIEVLEILVMDLIDTIDNPTELQQDLIEELLDTIDFEGEELPEGLDEGRVRKRIVRKGKVIKRIKCTGPNMKNVGGKCVRMDATERRKRAKSAKIAARKRRGKKASIDRKRKKSMGIHKRRIG